jgi:hypothetical protein
VRRFQSEIIVRIDLHLPLKPSRRRITAGALNDNARIGRSDLFQSATYSARKRSC